MRSIFWRVCGGSVYEPTGTPCYGLSAIETKLPIGFFFLQFFHFLVAPIFFGFFHLFLGIKIVESHDSLLDCCDTNLGTS
jgi:hypothetical protein